MSKPEIDIESLSPEERLELIGELWDSLSARHSEIPLTDAQRRELDRRVEDHERDPSSAVPWEEVQKRLRRRQ